MTIKKFHVSSTYTSAPGATVKEGSLKICTTMFLIFSLNCIELLIEEIKTHNYSVDFLFHEFCLTRKVFGVITIENL